MFWISGQNVYNKIGIGSRIFSSSIINLFQIRPMKITNEIFQVGGSGITSPEDGAIYLIIFGDEAALVDAGCGNEPERLFMNIQQCGVMPTQIKYLLITHCHYDHVGGIEGIREQTGCRVMAHEMDARYLERGDGTATAAKWYGASIHPVKIDEKISGNQQAIELGGREIKALHTPGHSPGSMVYLMESEGLTVLFGQDVHGPLDRSLHSNRADYVKSLNQLLALEADILCEGHFGIIKGKKEVANFIRSFL
jgi:glyoxylase-like metal-dependent hydrolase (beta-lactamase superfamily II)